VVPSQVIRCHLDFNADNVVADRAGRVWVIDWENSGGGDPAQELAQSLSAVAGTGDAAGAFLDGYRAAGGPGRLDDLDAFAMAFVVQASLVAFFGQRWLDDSNPRDAHRLADMLPNLLTLDRAHHLLDQLR
jgi:aminoglycoside phosphotransferase (APT) family kinase protein